MRQHGFFIQFSFIFLKTNVVKLWTHETAHVGAIDLSRPSLTPSALESAHFRHLVHMSIHVVELDSRKTTRLPGCICPEFAGFMYTPPLNINQYFFLPSPPNLFSSSPSIDFHIFLSKLQ